jgi:acyl-CoA thioesterase-1
VLLVGMRLPPNYGPKYTEEFDAAFRTSPNAKKIPLLPFLLEPVALDRDAFQADGLHPTAAATAETSRPRLERAATAARLMNC